MKHHKLAADPNVIEATNDADTFFIQDGVTTISGFDPAHDRVLFVGDSYSDIMVNLDFYDGIHFTTFVGDPFEMHALDYNHDGVMDTEIIGSGSDVILYSVLPEALHPWNLAGG